MEIQHLSEQGFFQKLDRWLNVPKYAILNPQRTAMLYHARQTIEDIFEREGVEAKVELGPTLFENGDALLSVESDSFVIRDVAKLFDVLFWAENFEVYPLENGKIRFAAIFKDIAEVFVMDSPAR